MKTKKPCIFKVCRPFAMHTCLLCPRIAIGWSDEPFSTDRVRTEQLCGARNGVYHRRIVVSHLQSQAYVQGRGSMLRTIVDDLSSFSSGSGPITGCYRVLEHPQLDFKHPKSHVFIISIIYNFIFLDFIIIYLFFSHFAYWYHQGGIYLTLVYYIILSSLQWYKHIYIYSILYYGRDILLIQVL
jgi:hypothetical protein